MHLKQVAIVMVGLTFFLSSAWGLNLFLRAGRLNNWLTIEQIRERVSTDLPPGTPLSEIDEYFIRNDIDHDHVVRTDEVYAMIHHIWGGRFLAQKDAWIKIALDENQMKSIKVEPVFTGP